MEHLNQNPKESRDNYDLNLNTSIKPSEERSSFLKAGIFLAALALPGMLSGVRPAQAAVPGATAIGAGVIVPADYSALYDKFEKLNVNPDRALQLTQLASLSGKPPEEAYRLVSTLLENFKNAGLEIDRALKLTAIAVLSGRPADKVFTEVKDLYEKFSDLAGVDRDTAINLAAIAEFGGKSFKDVAVLYRSFSKEPGVDRSKAVNLVAMAVFSNKSFSDVSALYEANHERSGTPTRAVLLTYSALAADISLAPSPTVNLVPTGTNKLQALMLNSVVHDLVFIGVNFTDPMKTQPPQRDDAKK